MPKPSAAPAPSPNATAIFGAFGQTPAPAPAKAPLPRPSSPNTTAIFGISAVSSVPPGLTQPQTPKELEAMLDTLREEDGLGEEDTASHQIKTELFAFTEGPGAAAAKPAPVKAAANKTQMFALSSLPAQEGSRPDDATLSFGPAPTPAPAPAPAPASASTTQMFGISTKPYTQQEIDGLVAKDPARHSTPAPMAQPPVEISRVTVPAKAFDRSKLDAAITESVPALADPRIAPPPPSRVELPHAAPRRLELNLEPSADSPEPEELFLRSRQRRSRMIMGGLIVAALAVAGLVAYLKLAQRTPELPLHAKAEHEAAMIELRKDDAESMQKATDRLTTLVQAYPFYVDAFSARVIALAFGLDDARQHVELLRARATAIKRQISRLQDAQQPSDWQNRANALTDELNGLDARIKPLLETIEKREEQLMTAVAALETLPQPRSPEDEHSLLRAKAIYQAIRGAAQASPLADRYRAEQQGQDDGWSALIMGHYALAAKVAPEKQKAVRAQLAASTSKDATFIRLYLVDARLAVAVGLDQEAIAALGAALLLNSRHELAAESLEWLKASSEDAP